MMQSLAETSSAISDTYRMAVRSSSMSVWAAGLIGGGVARTEGSACCQ